MKLAPVKKRKEAPKLLKLDIGCGKNCKPEFEGVDAIDFGQKHVCDVVKVFPKHEGKYIRHYKTGIYQAWPWKDNSIDEVHSSHFLEHLTWNERIHFFNELFRVMKSGATATIITPNWSHECFYGDPTHQAPASQWYRLYLCKEWRSTQAPHSPYTCNFPLKDQTCIGTLSEHLLTRNQEYQYAAGQTQINATRDLIVTLKKP